MLLKLWVCLLTSSTAMDDRIIDLYLSTNLMDDPDRANEKRTRLRQFAHHDREIQRVWRISNNEGEQGVVFRVKIEGCEYCLKLVCEVSFVYTLLSLAHTVLVQKMAILFIHTLPRTDSDATFTVCLRMPRICSSY